MENSKKQNKNLYIMKLLFTYDKFKEDLIKIRSEFGVKESGFLNDKEAQDWQHKLEKTSDNFWTSKKYKDLEKRVIELRGNKNYYGLRELQEHINSEIPINKFHNAIGAIMDKYNLRYNFWDAVIMYVLYDKIVRIPLYNFSFSFEPGKSKRAKWVNIKTYSRLSEKEIREAIKQLKEMQKWCLAPALNIGIREHKYVNKIFEIEGQMKKRRMKKTEVLDSYLKKVKKQHSEYQFKLAKKENKSSISYEKKYTSKDIAKKYFNDKTKSDLIRQLNSRLNKERKRLFGI